MQNRSLYIYPHIAIGLLLGLIFYFTFTPILKVDSYVMMFKSSLTAALYLVALLLVEATVVSQAFAKLEPKQQVINYIGLAVLFLLITVGGGLLLSRWIWNDLKEFFYPIIGIEVVVSLLIFTTALLCYLRIFTATNAVDPSEIDEEQSLDCVDDKESPNKEIVTLPTLTTTEYIERITVKDGQKIDIIPISDILQIQANGDYVLIQTLEKKFIKEQTMKSLEEQLPADQFVRIHRSNIVNVAYIARVEQYGKQSQLLKMQNGLQIKISVNGYKRLKEVLGL